MDFDGFNWDAANRVKCQKHGVSLGEIEAVFGSDPLVIPDLRHSISENRFHVVGQPSGGKPIFLVITLRRRMEALFIRVISARYMHSKEIVFYEKAKAISHSDE
jgi:uncharacterized DUF497 family protein